MTFDEIKKKIILSLDRLHWLLENADTSDDHWRFTVQNEIKILRERLEELKRII